LESLEMDLPRHLKDYLKLEAEREKRLIRESNASLLEKSPVLLPYKERILKAPHAAMVKTIRKQRAAGPQSSAGRDEALQVLTRIARFKYRHEHLDNATDRLSEAADAHFLLSFIFDRAFYGMYRQYWSRKQPWPNGPCLKTYGKTQSRT
ncbi:MAG: hypothetical protein ACOC7W_06485, partial [Desulfosalsimonas sp.]